MLKLAWPVVVEQLLNTLVGLVHIFLIGYLGAAALAGIGLAEQVIFIPMSVFAAISVGATAIVARYIGAGEPEQANVTTQQSVFLAVVIGLFFTIPALLFDEEIMVLLRARSDVVPMGAVYIRMVGATMPLATLMFVGTALLRGAGDTRTPLIIMTVVNVVNIVLSYLLIKGPFGLPELGVTGAGIAAMFGRGTGGVLALAILASGRWAIRWDVKRSFALSWREIKRILRIGLPAGIEQLQMRGSMMTYTVIISSLGTAAYAAHVVAIRIEDVAFMPGFGLGMAATTLVGQALGAERPDLAERTAHQARLFAMVIMGTLGFSFFLFGPQIMALFIEDADVISQGSAALKVMAFALPLIGIANTLAGGLRGAGDTKWVMWAFMFSMWCIRLPIAYLLSTVIGLGLPGAWVGAGIDMSTRGLLAWWRFAQGTWKSIKV